MSSGAPSPASFAQPAVFLAEVKEQHPVGGKARGLGKLIQAGFPVPEGFVVLPEATEEEIVAAYRRLGAPPVAVRSSADEEDSERLSYAGQFATFLNVCGQQSLLEAVEACRASARRLTAYLEESSAATRMCVIVQRMLEPEYAGVAFGQAEGEILVQGVAGLGEALVSGRSGPLCLPDGLRAEVERLARDVATRLGAPQDIEWAAENGRVWLLQARPITVPLPGPLPSRFRLWTATNLQEAIPRPLTPFSEELACEFVGRVFAIALKSFGLPAPDGPELRLVKGRFYMSYSAIASAMSAMPGFRMESQLRMYGDHPELARFVAYTPASRLGFLLRLPATLIRLLGWMLFIERRIQSAEAATQELDAKVRAAQSRGASDAEWLALFRFSLSFGKPVHEAMAFATAMAMGVLTTLLQVAGWLAPQVPGPEIAALANSGELDSLEPARQLVALGRWLRELPEYSEDASEVQSRLARFLQACGFRCENEPELAQPRWRERPAELLQLARQLAAAEPAVARGVSLPGATAAAANSGAPELPKRTWLRLALWPLSRMARTWQLRREASRAVLGRHNEALRRLLLEIGARAQARGMLAETGDVFYLLASEIEGLLSENPPGGLAARVARRRQTHEQLLALPPPPRLLAELPDGRLAPYQPDPGSGDTLRGFAASAGRVEGRARVLADLAQAADLQPGEVLVTRTTDIAWTPLFRVASAIVTEIGAPTSHAAIVARELGVPAVVNVDRCSDLIHTGDRLFVDGWAGLVRVSRSA